MRSSLMLAAALIAQPTAEAHLTVVCTSTMPSTSCSDTNASLVVWLGTYHRNTARTRDRRDAAGRGALV